MAFGRIVPVAALSCALLLQIFSLYLLSATAREVVNKMEPFEDTVSAFPESGAKTTNLLKDYSDVQEIVFNRVPKTASTTTLSITGEIAKRNNFFFFHSRTYHEWHLQNFTQQYEFARHVASLPKPFILDRHIRVMNFAKFNLSQPGYITMVREPLGRLDSMHRMLTLQHPGLLSRYHYEKNMTFEECIEGDFYPCSNSSSYFVMVPFFCGHTAFCSVPSTKSLAAAKRNLRKYFILVGIQEDYEAFLEGLEHLIPQFYAGALQYYKDNGVHMKEGSGKPVALKPKTKKKMQTRLKEEYDIYRFARQHFYKLQKAWRNKH